MIQIALKTNKGFPDNIRGARIGNREQHGLLLFANRAYTPTARLPLERIDLAGTTYDAPQVHVTPDGYVMRLTALPPRGAPQTSDYRWQDDRWLAVRTLRLLQP